MRREAEGRQKEDVLAGQLMELLEIPKEDQTEIRAYLTDHTLPALLCEYPFLGLTTVTEKKLEAVALLSSYGGKEVSWKQSVPAGNS